MTIPDHLITPLDWSAEALRHAAAWTGQPEGARALVESRRYLAMHELIERLRAERDAARAEAEALRRERDELKARERTCPTMLEAEARALMRARQCRCGPDGCPDRASCPSCPSCPRIAEELAKEATR